MILISIIVVAGLQGLEAKIPETSEEKVAEKVTDNNKELQDITDTDQTNQNEKEKPEKERKDEKDKYDTVTIAMAGDTTLGEDKRRTTDEQYSFNYVFEREDHDYGYFFRNVKDIFNKSDISLVNFEGVLTEREEQEDRDFVFKGPPEYARILEEGNIDAVSLANNHSFDYGEDGFRDTLNTLDNYDIGYFIDNISYTREINEIKFKFLGFTGWNAKEYTKEHVGSIIESAEENADILVVSFHWGGEYEYYPNEAQKTLGRLAVDKGADLVWGHHPHVLQGIEEYKGVNIAYSLGNFCFGGHTGPEDMDTIIFKQHFHFQDNTLVETEYEIIPCSISSVVHKNNFQPTLLDGENAERVRNKVEELSQDLR